MRTLQLTPRLIKMAKKLSPSARLILAEMMTGGVLEKDNFGQLVLYTGFTIDRRTHRVRRCLEEDSE
jgi:hypothetical protein